MNEKRFIHYVNKLKQGIIISCNFVLPAHMAMDFDAAMALSSII